MRIQRIRIGPNQYNYLLIGNDNRPIDLAAKYLKYLHNVQRAQNTLLTYCTGLKFFYEYLDDVQKNVAEVGIYELSDFLLWLLGNSESNKIIPYTASESHRTARTVNLYITIVTNYYEFLFANYYIDINKTDRAFVEANGKFKHYKNFLYHITKNKMTRRNILKLKPSKKRPKRLTQEEVAALVYATTNIRDEFLLRLLHSTGMRIGEALALYHEDIIQCNNGLYKIIIVDRKNNINDVSCKTGYRELYIGQEILDLYDDYCYFLECSIGIGTNYIFVKLTGPESGMPMKKSNVYSLFRELKKKTNIDVHPHILRATNGTISYESTKNIEYVRENLGHKQIQTTIGSYLFPSDDEIIAEWKKAQTKLNENLQRRDKTSE